nr:hypothetical protein CFP56_24461 [Quercus suber]
MRFSRGRERQSEAFHEVRTTLTLSAALPDHGQRDRQLRRRHRRMRQSHEDEATRENRRSHHRRRAEAAKLRPGVRDVGVRERSEQSPARRHPARGRGAHGEEVPAARRQRRQVRRQRVRTDQQGWGADWDAAERGRGQGVAGPAVEQDPESGADASVRVFGGKEASMGEERVCEIRCVGRGAVFA